MPTTDPQTALHNLASAKSPADVAQAVGGLAASFKDLDPAAVAEFAGLAKQLAAAIAGRDFWTAAMVAVQVVGLLIKYLAPDPAPSS